MEKPVKCVSVTAHLGELLLSEASGERHSDVLLVSVFLFIPHRVSGCFVFHSAMFAHNNESMCCVHKHRYWEPGELSKCAEAALQPFHCTMTINRATRIRLLIVTRTTMAVNATTGRQVE